MATTVAELKHGISGKISNCFAGLPLTLAHGHEGHHAECNDTTINAVKADIQAMGEGEAKTTVKKCDALIKGRLEAGPQGDPCAQKGKLGRALLHALHGLVGLSLGLVGAAHVLHRP